MPPANSADNQRIYRLYCYLCTCLAMKQKADGTPNFRAIGARLSDNNDFRKVVSSLFQDGELNPSQTLNLGRSSNMTTGSLVNMLTRLSQSLESDYHAYEEPYTRVLTLEDILTALYKLIELTPEERRALSLPDSDGLTLLQRALLTLQTVGGLNNYEMLFRVYKATVGLDFANAEPPLNNLDQVDGLIASTVEQALSYLPNRPRRQDGNETSVPGRNETVLELTQKAQREIRRLLARSGNQQSPLTGNIVINSYIRHYFRPAFVVKLAQTVVANERLTDQYPVYLKRITVEAYGPLPFADKELGILQADGPYPALLHPALRRLDQPPHFERVGDLPGPGDYELASQESTKIVAEFYVKVPKTYSPVVERVFSRLASENKRRIDFSLSSTGIGGALSHVIKVINKGLLEDISCLEEYFSIAHDVTSTQEIIRDNVPSPVWAHNLVKLCRKETVGQTVEACDRDHLRSYEEFSFADPIGHGNYCGFDFLASQAQAALQARLSAIRNAGVMPEQYILSLCQRTEYLIALQDAWSYLHGYPFSSFAMIGAIQQEILRPNVGDRLLTKGDRYIFFDAYLSIIEALLDEGAYRPARQYLERVSVLNDFVQQGLSVNQQTASIPKANFEVFSGALIVRYLLCLANYYYLYDTDERDVKYLPPDCTPDINREGLVRRAWNALDQAQQHISVRLRKYVVVNEVSQGTFHPHYSLLSRIALLRAKLLLFFPRSVLKDDQYLPTDRFAGQQRTEASVHWGRLYLAEKARLYSAADGNSEIYACYASLQCWIYLIAAYAEPGDLTLPPASNAIRSTHSQTLARQDCLRWAKQLRDHALISYADIGRKYYYQIKEKSGLPKQTDPFGPHRIQKIPPIYEARGQEYQQLSHAAGDFLVLDISLLAVYPEILPKLSPNHPTRSIYLFGTNACYLFFARGMYLLCSDTSQEFDDLEHANGTIQWSEKLHHAMRLLNMAWAIAEEGCEIQRETPGNEMRFSMTRSLTPNVLPDEYTSQEVDSVRDLYPRRITEIADLGKIFSAACMVLQLYTMEPDHRLTTRTDITKILNSVHGAHRLNRTLRALLSRQSQYNGHLRTYLNQAKAIVTRHADMAQAAPDVLTDVSRQRRHVLTELFSILLT